MILTVSVHTGRASALIKAGHENRLGSSLSSHRGLDPRRRDRVVWTPTRGPVSPARRQRTKPSSGGSVVQPRHDGFRFAEIDGRLSLTAGSVRVAGPTLQVWRTPTENDLIRDMPAQDAKPGSLWHRWGLDALHCVLEHLDDREMRAVYLFKKERRAEMTVTLDRWSQASSWYTMRVSVWVHEAIDDLPRVGLRFAVPGDFDLLEWYGRGPHESYPDRSVGARLGRWTQSVSDTRLPYVVPQEFGGHTDTRVVSLGNRGRGNSRRRPRTLVDDRRRAGGDVPFFRVTNHA